jgi:ABC-type phosphate transport system substrate-binding protein
MLMSVFWTIPAPAFASGTAQINGSGSTWAYNAVNAWIGEVSAQGLRVTFNPNGSAAGRQDFANRAVDYAVSDIGFQGQDPLTGTNDTSSGRAFAYVPLVAGGTSFPYHLTVAGQLVRNLRLSGATLAGIFTGAITNWDAPQISKDNNGRKFPSIPIVPLVHSEGSGTSYQFSAYLAQEFPSVWTSFAGKDKPTEYWPSDKANEIALNGSDQLMNYLASGSGQGAIGYDEYSYAIAKNIPVAKIENQAGYFTLPTQYNVAVALTQAIINYNKTSPDYLLESLKDVYGYSDKRTYPLSSYSYGIIPTAANDGTMSTPKRQALADFLYTSICQGQGAIGQIGYSALPINLVQAAFAQIGLLKKVDSQVSLTNLNVTTCGNPTFVAGKPKENHLAQIAPEPPLCDEVGHGPCTSSNDTTGPPPPTPQGTKSSPPPGSKTGAGGHHSSSPSPGASPNPGTSPNPGKSSSAGIDPVTGLPSSSPNGNLTTATVETEPVTLGVGASSGTALAVLAAVLFLAAIVIPPTLARRWLAKK